MDIGKWLRDLDLERYAEAFVANEIDAEILPKLTAEDLKDLGVALVGQRRRLLEAIATLRDSALPVEAFDAKTSSLPSGESAVARSEAERRQLTVMFVDLVGSTALSARLDPEEMREVIRAYQNAVAGEITRFEGHVAKFMGDGVLAYFGWPRAHEDEAERAARAGLAITAAIGQLSSPAGEALAARVGIATGLVVVGDLVGEGAAQEQAVVGDTPNFAARLQGIAAPGQVVIADATRRLLGASFELEDLGQSELKGISEPVPAFAVKGERPVESRFEAMSGPSLPPMVGRDQELALLLERWALAKAGEGQGVLLVGEAGIGKSRISRALLDALAAEPHVRVRYQCSPYHTDSALWPVIQQLNHAAGLDADDALEVKLDKLDALLDRARGREAAPLIADLLGLDGAPRYGPLDLTPQVQRARTLHALAAQLLGLAIRQPVLVVLEDAHWTDPTTLELIEQCLDRIANARVLILMTSRPDQQPALAAHPHVTRLTLNRLGRAGVESIVVRLGGDHLPSETINTIIARTDGVPLFVEELTKAVLETGETSVPASLHDSLMARLDRIPEVKEVAQIAACIGREFDYALLAAVAARPESDLRSSLDKLATAELIFRRGTPPAASYTFKHALVQDAAYQSLLKSKRQQLHARIAQVLEQGLSDGGETGPEVLAQHLTAAGLAERALAYWRRAGELAASHSADLEAIAHLNKGLELVGTLPATPEGLNEELTLRLAIGLPLIATKGIASSEAERTYRRASALCEQLGRSAELFPVLRGLWNCYFVRGELQRAHDLAARLAEVAEKRGTPVQRALARRALGTSLLYFGRFTDAAEELNQGIAIDDAVAAWEDSAHLLLYTERAGLACRLYLAWVLWLLGFPDRALKMMEEGISLSQSLSHAYSLAFALGWAAVLHNWRREFTLAKRRAETAIDIATAHRLPQLLAVGTMHRGFALVGLGQPIEGLPQLGAGLAIWNGVGAHLLDTQWLGFIAQAHFQAGSFEDALITLDQACQAVAATGECHYQAELYRLRGVISAESGEATEAASWLQQAVAMAQNQQAKSLELRAATSLARVWIEQGERWKAHDLLAPVYDWFTEGFETPDLKDAKELLDG